MLVAELSARDTLELAAVLELGEVTALVPDIVLVRTGAGGTGGGRCPGVAGVLRGREPGGTDGVDLATSEDAVLTTRALEGVFPGDNDVRVRLETLGVSSFLVDGDFNWYLLGDAIEGGVTVRGFPDFDTDFNAEGLVDVSSAFIFRYILALSRTNYEVQNVHIPVLTCIQLANRQTTE